MVNSYYLAGLVFMLLYLRPPWTNSCQIWCVRGFHHILLKYGHKYWWRHTSVLHAATHLSLFFFVTFSYLKSEEWAAFSLLLVPGDIALTRFSLYGNGFSRGISGKIMDTIFLMYTLGISVQNKVTRLQKTILIRIKWYQGFYYTAEMTSQSKRPMEEIHLQDGCSKLKPIAWLHQRALWFFKTCQTIENIDNQIKF